MAAARMRIVTELRELTKARGRTGPPQPGEETRDVILFPNSEESLYAWTAFILGPHDTPFEGARFKLSINVPREYPLTPPVVRFVTKVCHPNIHFKTGEICLDILKAAWTPVWSLETTCRAIMALLAHPEASSPLNCDAGNLVRAGDLRGYWSLARMYTLEYGEPLAPAVTGGRASGQEGKRAEFGKEGEEEEEEEEE